MPKKPDEIVYIHEPREGAFIQGLPQRDLTQADVDRASSLALRDGLASGLYRKATKTETDEARKQREKDEAAEAKAAAEAAKDNER
jgi:hypothetical protein